VAGVGTGSGLGPKRILDAVKQLEAASQIFTLPLTALEGLRFPAQAAQFIFDGKARQAAEEEWARVDAQGATLVTYSCAEYPERLKEIYDPPPVLWVRGPVSLLSRPGLRLWARGIRLRMARAWRRCWRGIWRCGGC